ncbi:GntR family transcriptional regulator [Novosphingobium resinovorum]|jgi:DNA-binding GntR family transcriptional regulator|uniref:GntR family transcriptional regulator n=1 Tax=Novosphingobium TaxID=165696 RepID=UPI001B3C7584|nr:MULTISPECIES: GntR family transcriptional regulator [Novosphingobium]MBF7015002.1 GntR family transcriptional regulator [Novosphingobium sp. HR1a]WJM24528.1 GntR family transcriptional regulator [Novosphingobium resinovorum]
MTIVVRTLAERIFDVIRERIVEGKLPVMEPVRQDALAAELGVSKIPLREALARLEHEGLLTSQANRGWFVRPMSQDQAEEIYLLRLATEPAAAAYACARADESDKEAARRAFDILDAAAKGDRAEVAVRNREFHVSLVRPGKRLLTTQLVERLEVLAERYVIAHLEPAGRGDRAHNEHSELLDTWLAGDANTVKDLLTAHIASTLDDLRAHFTASQTG